MKIAVFTTSKEWKQYFKTGFTMSQERIEPIQVDYLNTEDQFWPAIEKNRYELILLCTPLQKRISWGLFLDSMERIWTERAKISQKQIWHFGRRIIALEEQEIYYIFSVQKAVSVHDHQKSYRIRTNMKQEEHRLSSALFFRIHRNCLVNLIHVDRIDGNYLILRNGTSLQVSTRRRKRVKERLLLFWGESVNKRAKTAKRKNN